MNKEQGFFKKSINFLRFPPLWLIITTFILTAIFAGLSLVFVFIESISNLSYIFFALAGLTLFYSIFIAIKLFSKIKKSLSYFFDKFKLTRLFFSDFNARIIIIAVITFCFNIAIGLFNGYLSLTLKSVWYGALFGYYVFLAMFKAGILIHKKRTHNKKNSLSENEIRLNDAKVYFNCGVIVLFLGLALSVAITMTVLADKNFNYPDWTVFAFAGIAFYKIIISIVNILKSKKQSDLTIQAISNINLTAGAVSLLALQTALLNAFSDGTISTPTFNAVTGFFVMIVVITTAIKMILTSKKTIKQIKSENTNG